MGQVLDVLVGVKRLDSDPLKRFLVQTLKRLVAQFFRGELLPVFFGHSHIRLPLSFICGANPCGGNACSAQFLVASAFGFVA